jgi:hypothetical protein
MLKTQGYILELLVFRNHYEKEEVFFFKDRGATIVFRGGGERVLL